MPSPQPVGDDMPSRPNTDVTVSIETSVGSMLIELYPERAPRSTEAFLAMVNAATLRGARFWRVVREDNDASEIRVDVVQAQFDVDTGFIAHESTLATTLRHVDGVVSLAREAVGTATAGDIFICIGDQPALDFGGLRNIDGQGFAAFGRVIDGMDVVRRIHGMPTEPDDGHDRLGRQKLLAPVAILAMRSKRPDRTLRDELGASEEHR